MKSYAIVVDGRVINVVLWDGVSDWVPPEGATANLLSTADQAAIGYLFDGKTYTAPSDPA